MNANKPASVPRLRFSEFRDAGEWSVGKLGEKEISTFVKDKVSLDQIDKETYVSTANLLPDYGGVTAISKLPSSGSFTRYRTADILLSNIRPYLKKVWLADGGGGTSNDVLVIRANSRVTGSFLAYQLRNDRFITDIMKGAKGVKMPRGDLSLMKEFPVLIPEKEEQQKIANCLGSLDDLIADEGRKLEALRQHKQGLMQQLFPQTGQSRPRLRFPEFRNAVEWQRCALGKIAELSKGKGISKSDVVHGGRTPCVRYGELYTVYGEIIEIVKSRTNLPTSDLVHSKAGDVIIPASGETKEDIATCACVVDDGVALGSDLNVIRSPVDGRFFSYYLNGTRRRELANVAQGDTVAHLYPTQLSRLEVYIPDAKAEQQRIADCLSSLDTRFSGQVQKLNALKTHKQGLMQQLFPSLEHH